MSERSSIFENEWRRCLNEHYKYVIREQDTVTEETLTPIMHRVGYSDDDLRQLYREATSRADELPEDFVPDMARALPGDSALEPTFQVHPAECQCAACMDNVLEIGHDAEGQPLTTPLEPEDAQGNLFIVRKPDESKPDASADDADEDKPRQISLF